MTQPPQSPTTAGMLHGVVFAVPSNRRVTRALVRFFEVRSDYSVKHGPEAAKSILQAGVPVGSALTDDRGEFSIPYAPPKSEVAIAFLVEGPELGDACDIVSWSCRPRKVGAGSEAFLIGIDERIITKRRVEREGADIAHVRENIARRARAMEHAKPKAARERLAGLRWIPEPARQTRADTSVIQVLPPDADQEQIQRLNALAIESAYIKKRKGDSKRPGVPRRVPPRKKIAKQTPRGQSRLGSPAENQLFSVNAVVDRLDARMKRLVNAQREEAHKAPLGRSAMTPPREPSRGGRS